MAAPLRELPDLAALLSACGDDALVAYEVGPELPAPPLALGRAVLFRRETQLGFAGAAALGPVDDLAALLMSPWRQVPGWEGERSITVPAASEPTLRALGVRGVGLWTTMSLRPGDLRRRPTPDGIRVDFGLDRGQARSFVDEHYSARWLAPEPAGETWVALRDEAGEVWATGLAAMTPAGVTRLSSITVSRDARRRGLGWALAQALTDFGLSRSAVVTLGVDDDNPVAMALYPAMGYRVDHALASGALPPLPRTPRELH